MKLNANQKNTLLHVQKKTRWAFAENKKEVGIELGNGRYTNKPTAATIKSLEARNFLKITSVISGGIVSIELTDLGKNYINLDE